MALGHQTASGKDLSLRGCYYTKGTTAKLELETMEDIIKNGQERRGAWRRAAVTDLGYGKVWGEEEDVMEESSDGDEDAEEESSSESEEDDEDGDEMDTSSN